MAESTIVTAHHAYEPQREDELGLNKGDIVTVTDSSDPDWWLGKKDDGSSGYFPSNFVEPASAHDDSNEEAKDDSKDKPKEVEDSAEAASPSSAKPKSIGMARVMEDYAMQGPDELTLHCGDIATLHERLEDGWLQGEIKGKVGRFPGECVEEIDMPGRPDLGAQSSDAPAPTTESNEDAEPSKPAFKLAAYGVKQGGIGSLLAGGFPQLKKAGAPKKAPEPEMPSPPPVEKAIPPPVEKPSPPPVEKASPPVEKASPPVEKASPPPPVEKASPPPVEKPSPPPTEKPSPPPAESPVKGAPTVPINKFDQEQSTEKFVAKAIVLHPYDAENEDELNLLRGEYVNVLDKNVDDGWWKGTTERGQTGVFPSNFVKEIEEEAIASPPPVRSRKSVTSSGSQQSFNTASSSRVSSGISARAPPLPSKASRPSSTASESIHEPQPTEVPPPTIPEEPTPPIALPPKPVESPEEEEAEPAKEEPEEKKASPAPTSPPVPKRPSLPTSRPASEAHVEPEKPASPSPVSSPEEAKDEPSPPPPKPAARPASVTSPNEGQASPVEKEVEAPKESTKVEEEVLKASPEESPKLEETIPKETVEEEVASPKVEEPAKEEETSTEEVKSPIVSPEEEKKSFDLQPTGPKLSAPSRARPGRARRSPEARKEEPSQMELLKQDLSAEPEEEPKKEEEEEKKVSPPAKPVKPIFAKFQTPFGGAAPELKNLKPVQRRMWEPAAAHEPEKKEEETNEPPRPTGVRNIASRFNVPSSGNEVLETKLKNYTKNEVDKLRKELQEEREKRVQLEELVASLAEQVERLQQ